MRRMTVLMLVLVCITLGASQGAVASPSGVFTHLGSVSGATNAIAIAGQYAYIGEGLGLTVMELSDPEQPVAVGRTDPIGIVDRLVVSGDYVYAVAGPFGDLWVIDVSDPTEPTLVTSDDSHWVWALCVDGSYLYAGAFGDGLYVYDISDPTVLQEVGYLETGGFPYDVDAAGGVAYIADRTGDNIGELWIVDVSEPTEPEELARIDEATYNNAYGVAVAGETLYTGYDGMFRVIDVSDPAHPVEEGAASFFGGLERIALSGDLAFLVTTLGDVVSVDISNPADPQVLSSYHSGYWASDLAVTDYHLYFTDQSAGVWVVDMTDPAAPVAAGGYDSMCWMEGVVARGDYAYVADSMEGLMVVDVSDPALPQAVGFYNSPYESGVEDLALDGNHVYLATGFYGLRVVDVSDPTSPTEVGAFDSHGVGNVALQDGYAYLTHDWGEFYIVDVSDPAHPTEVAAYDLDFRMGTIQVSGDYAYIAGELSGFAILDISDPQAVTQVGLFTDGSHYMIDVALMGDYALVAVRDYYVLVLDISDPTQIEQVGSYSSSPRAVAVEGNRAYIAEFTNLEVIDVQDPASPSLVDSIDLPSGLFQFHDVYPIDGRLYVVGMDSGLLLYADRPVSPGDERIYLPIIVR